MTAFSYKDIYPKARELRQKGLSFSSIASLLDIPESTVYGWLAKNKVPNRPYNQGSPEMLSKLSPDLAYVIGVMHGDGFVRPSVNSISLTVKDWEFCSNFKEKLERWAGISCTQITRRKCDGLWNVSLSSKAVCDIIVNFNLTNLLTCHRGIKANFLRGLYDSEGSIIASKLHDRRISERRIYLYSTNKGLLELVKRLLNDFDIFSSLFKQPKCTSHIGRKDVFMLKIRRKDSIKKFYEAIGFSIERKQEKLKAAVNSFCIVGPTTDKIMKILLYKAPLSADEIASELGRSRYTIKGCIYGKSGNNLLKKGYMQNIYSRTSKKFAKYILTEEGKRLINGGIVK